MSESIYKDNISEYMVKLKNLVPELSGAWMGYHDEVFKDGAISNKDKQLIAMACAHITGCPYCIRARTKSSKAQGATDEQIAEAVFIAMRLAMGQPYAFGSIAFENYNLMKEKKDVTEGYLLART